MIKREKIIKKLREKLEPLKYVYTFWLEGSDANNTVYEYSDIDFWVDFEDEFEQQCYDAVRKRIIRNFNNRL